MNKTPVQRVIPLIRITAGNNDRTYFDPVKLKELSDSIKEHGLLQPISVRYIASTRNYQIIAGERRYRASMMAELSDIPCNVLDVSDEEASILMMAENTARENLSPMDEARAFSVRIAAYGWTNVEVAKRAGVSPSLVGSRLKLLKLSPTLQTLVNGKQLALSYAECIGDHGLSECAQLKAVELLNKTSSPNMDWFRKIVSEIAEREQQGELFDDLEMMSPEIVAESTGEKINVKDLPHPMKSEVPPKPDGDKRTVLEYQRDFWAETAALYKKANAPWLARECDNAARALDLAIRATGDSSSAPIDSALFSEEAAK